MGIFGNDLKIDDSRLDEMNLVLGSYRSIRYPIAYVSMPITSGKLLYEILEKKGCRNLEELSEQDPKSIFLEIIQPNIEMGIAAADKLRIKSKLPPIAPSVFEAKKQRWSQEEYMFLWFRVIEELAEEVHMTEGWEYSNGGAQEFVKAMEMQFGFANTNFFQKNIDTENELERMKKIKVFDNKRKEIRLNKGSELLTSAIIDLRSREFDSESLKTSLHKLTSIGGFFYDSLTSRSEYEQHSNYLFNWKNMNENWGTVCQN